MKKPTVAQLWKAHALFLKEITAELLALGAVRGVYREEFVSEDGVKVPRLESLTLDTRHGPLVLHVDIPWRLNKGEILRPNLTVFGRFTDAERARAAGIRHKLNFHFGERTEDEVCFCVGDVCSRIEQLIPTV